mmetsp:Transcript_36119/g.103207  ORF Transcript_36119/g.103207 Transcript_36119/m.103207 type:complete len:221 (+) Transcript_36119:38-700(+)
MPAHHFCVLAAAALSANEATAALLRSSASPAAVAGITQPSDPFDISCFYTEPPLFPGRTETGGEKGRSYRGLVAMTSSGRTCQKWTETHPWNDTASLAPVADKEITDGMNWGNGLGNHNFCRNPDQSMDQPWCFTMDPTEDHKKEACNIPQCPAQLRDFHAEHQDLVNAIRAQDCECAEELYGSTLTTKDTYVPLRTGLVQRAVGRTKDGRPCDCDGGHR